MKFLSLLLTYILVSLTGFLTQAQEVLSDEPVMGFQTDIEGTETRTRVRTRCRYARLGFGKIPNCPAIGKCSTKRTQKRPIHTCARNWKNCNGVYFRLGRGDGCAVTKCPNPKAKLLSSRGYVYLSCSHQASKSKKPCPKKRKKPAKKPKKKPAKKPAKKPKKKPANNKSKPKPKKPANKSKPAPKPKGGKCAEIARDILKLMNAHRRKNGAKPLCFNAKLQKAAVVHSKGMVVCNKTSHSGCPKYKPDLPKVGERIKAVGYKWRSWGENVAGGHPTAQAVFNGWKKSPGHNANMLNKSFNQVGISAESKDGKCAGRKFYTQVFGNSKTEPCSKSIIEARLIDAQEIDYAKEQDI